MASEGRHQAQQRPVPFLFPGKTAKAAGHDASPPLQSYHPLKGH